MTDATIKLRTYAELSGSTLDVVNMSDLDTYGYSVSRGGYSPKVGQRQLGLMAGVSPYEPVSESMRVTIKGSDEVDVLNKYTNLAQMMVKATEWGLGANVRPVFLDYQHKGSSLLVSSVIYAASIEPSGMFPSVGYTNYMLEATLKFVRRALWVHASTDTDATSASSGNPVVQSIAFSEDQDIPCPYSLQLDLSDTPVANDWYLFCAGPSTGSNSHIQALEGEAATGDTNMSSHVDSSASGGNTLMTDTGVSSFSAYWLPFTDWESRRVAAFAVLINNSDTLTFEVTPSLVSADSVTRSNRLIRIQTSSVFDAPKIIPLGELYAPRALSNYSFQLDIEASASVSSGHELEIDYIVLVAIDDNTRIVHMTEAINNSRLYLLTPETGLITPSVYADNTFGWRHDIDYYGDAHLDIDKLDLDVLLIGNKNTTGGGWVITNSGGTELNVTVSATRYRAYLTPPGVLAI